MKKKIIIAFILIVGMCSVIGFNLYSKNHNNKLEENNAEKINNEEKNDEEVLYSTIYYFEFGSRSVKIYKNGKVYDDLAIEDLNHQENYKYLKTLSEEELNNLSNKIKTVDNEELLKDYVIELVYGVKEFDNLGNY